MDFRLQPSLFCLAPRILQPPVVPDGNYAKHGEKERAALGQDVPHLRGDEEAGGGDAVKQGGGSLHARPLHGGRPLGHRGGLHCGEQPEGAVPKHAGDVHQGRYPGQAGDEELLRVPGVQDSSKRCGH